LDEQKIGKSSYKEYYKNKIQSFELETFKTLECPKLKNGLTCKLDRHLCYYYHTPSERRRPPTLFRYTNEMCPDQTYKENGKIKSRCKNGDFCHLCHSIYEYNYHKLFYGKAMTCLRKKKNGRCIYEETCYGYHPYKEPGYKKTKEEIIQEKKDEILDKYNNDHELLSGLISNYKCQNCEKYNKKFQFCVLLKCDHIICHNCFKKIVGKKCPICDTTFDKQKEGDDFILMNMKESSESIDSCIKKNYEERIQKKVEEEKNKMSESNIKDDDKGETQGSNKKKKGGKDKEKKDEVSDDSDGGNSNNSNSMDKA
jgi:hypothetical protein